VNAVALKYSCDAWHEVLKANPDLFTEHTTPAYTQVDFEVVTYGHCLQCHSTIGLPLDREPLIKRGEESE
jgi:hypothetical protein